MSRSVTRFAQWTIGAPRDGAPRPVWGIRCCDPRCEEESGPSPSHLAPDTWALRHAGRTGHTEFEETVRCPLIATPKEATR